MYAELQTNKATSTHTYRSKVIHRYEDRLKQTSTDTYTDIQTYGDIHSDIKAHTKHK